MTGLRISNCASASARSPPMTIEWRRIVSIPAPFAV
jgi:hypothetical protein